MFSIKGDTEKIIKHLIKSLKKSKIKIVKVYNIDKFINEKRKK